MYKNKPPKPVHCYPAIDIPPQERRGQDPPAAGAGKVLGGLTGTGQGLGYNHRPRRGSPGGAFSSIHVPLKHSARIQFFRKLLALYHPGKAAKRHSACSRGYSRLIEFPSGERTQMASARTLPPPLGRFLRSASYAKSSLSEFQHAFAWIIWRRRTSIVPFMRFHGLPGKGFGAPPDSE